MLTTKKLTESKPQTQLNWCGKPMGPEEYYGGRPEHQSPRDRQKSEALSPEKLAMLRASMANARAQRWRKRVKGKPAAHSGGEPKEGA